MHPVDKETPRDKEIERLFVKQIVVRSVHHPVVLIPSSIVFHLPLNSVDS